MLGKTSYEQQRLAMQHNRLSRCHLKQLNRPQIVSKKEQLSSGKKMNFEKIDDETLNYSSDLGNMQ